MHQSAEDQLAQFAAPYRHKATGVVVLLLHGERTTAAAYGRARTLDAIPPEHHVFEIGSITKVFTAMLLARLAIDGLIDPDRSIADISSEFAGAPEWITPRRLATHASGLPRLHLPIWKLLLTGVPADPYATFARDDLVRWLRDWRPSRGPTGNAHAYSNLGAGLLGEVLASSQGRDYQDLLNEKVLLPMGLADTAINLSEDQQRRFAQPHSASGRPVVPWTFKAMAGAGALRSTAGDLARFARGVIEAIAEPHSPIELAVARTAEPVVGLGPRAAMIPVAQCLGWIRMTLDPAGPWMLFHDGGTAGSASALYVCPPKRAAIVVLANRGVAAGILSNLKLIWSNSHRLAHDCFGSL